MFDKGMQKALEADGEKLRQLTGQDHGPYFPKPYSVYLAGPISGLSYAFVTSWRYEAAKMLMAIGLEAVDPLRYISEEDFYALETFGRDKYGRDLNLFLERDLKDIMECQAIMINLNGVSKHSVGTLIELGYATAHKKLVVLVRDYEARMKLAHPWFDPLAAIQAESVELAVRALEWASPLKGGE